MSDEPKVASGAPRSAIGRRLMEKEELLAKSVEEYLAALHDVRDPASIDRVRGWRLSIATAACNWLDARKVNAESLRACADELDTAPQLDWIEQRLRTEWWLGHGCPFAALYGDDGEMQCNNIARHGSRDFKRDDLLALKGVVESCRLEAASKAQAADALAPPEPTLQELARDLAYYKPIAERLMETAPRKVQQLHDVLRAIRRRLHFVGMPQEPRDEDGRPKWSAEIALIENALREPAPPRADALDTPKEQ